MAYEMLCPTCRWRGRERGSGSQSRRRVKTGGAGGASREPQRRRRRCLPGSGLEPGEILDEFSVLISSHR
jgi:hypothetical protein